MRDPVFVLLGVPSTMLDDAQADINDIAVVDWLACSAGIGSTNEEAHCMRRETFGGMPGGGHSLPILLMIFGCGTSILFDEPIKHV